MMFKKIVSFLLVFSILLNPNNFISYSEKSRNKILILYESPKIMEDVSNKVNTLYNLLHHFDVDINVKNINNYVEKDINKYDYIFVFNIYNRISINENLLKDLSQSDNQIIWIGPNIEFFLNKKKTPLLFQGEQLNFLKVSYNKKSYSVPNFLKFPLLTSNDDSINIISNLYDGKNSYPYILNFNNFHYIGSFETEGPLYYIFSDYLYDLFNINASHSGKIFVRIEDVHPFRDCSKLKKIADYLYSENIPFMIALIPSFLNTETGKYTTISDMPEFKETIQYMVSKGGSVVLHGYSHQYYKTETGEGYEFWDSKKDAPLKENIHNFVYDRISKGVNECLKNGIYPLAFEPPHYAMSQDGYIELKKYFSTIVAHYQPSDMGFSTNSFPFEIKNSRHFNILLPENLGFVETKKEEESIKEILHNYKDLKIVRNYNGGFFFHPYKNISYLKQVISNLKSQGAEFYSLSDYENWVKVDSTYIKNNKNKIITNYNIKEDDSSNKSLFSYFTLLLTALLLIILLSLLIIFYFYRKKSKQDIFVNNRGDSSE